MTRKEKIAEFREKYSISKVYNRLSFLMIYKGIIPYEGSKLVYRAGDKYPLSYVPLEYAEEGDDLIVIENLDPLVDALSIKDRALRAQKFLQIVGESLIKDDSNF
jgi:hypothetical protein